MNPDPLKITQRTVRLFVRMKEYSAKTSIVIGSPVSGVYQCVVLYVPSSLVKELNRLTQIAAYIAAAVGLWYREFIPKYLVWNFARETVPVSRVQPQMVIQ